MNDSQSLIVNMRFKPSNARSNGSKMHNNTILCTLLHNIKYTITHNNVYLPLTDKVLNLYCNCLVLFLVYVAVRH
ncbi:hypothetical protein RHMOL_Rhmol03G0201800 [Rhododendron molle]|uniref:Uncharacterized protein n=1 Tax=Rhododendron molle TaxID=49168 RepID=A0ACC0PJL6_RHOML|nr:hypothetical protein RHMOL_Rhmol03G0201800 [Rhododendron molle]